MQIQIKKQLKIELDQADIVEAVGDFLLKHNQKVSAAELEAINFVKSPKDGLRATLNITEESGVDTDEDSTHVLVTGIVPVVKKPTLEQSAEPAEEPVEEPVEEDEDEEPGIIATSSVEDVMPSVDEMAQLVEQPVATEDAEEEVQVTAAPVASRSALFSNQ